MPDDPTITMGATERADQLRCAEALQLMTEFLEEALDGFDLVLFETHLADCEGCLAYLSQIQTTIRLISQAGRLNV